MIRYLPRSIHIQGYSLREALLLQCKVKAGSSKAQWPLCVIVWPSVGSEESKTEDLW
jgi:hypothetical protein